jgi:UDP-N-acetylglucosamine:LPS N-acetylglucosamine transferase
MNKKIGFALICFYEASAGGHGSAEVSNSLYECLPQKNSKIFEIKKKKIFTFLEYYKFNYLENIYKFFYILIIINQLKNFIKKFKKKIIIIEGASWIGYSYFFLKLIKYYYSRAIIIYHAHNIEYELREKKNNFIIGFITKILERKIYKLANFATAVSIDDQKKLKKLYNVKSYFFPNGINKKRLLKKKPKFNIPKKYIIFSGSYSYKYNKEAINKIILKIMPVLIKKYKSIKLIITGKDFPQDRFKKYNFIKNYINLTKKELNYLIIKSLFMLTPMSKSPGTKLKVIETLLLGANLITSKEGVRGVNFIKNKKIRIYSNTSQMYRYINDVIRNYSKIKINKTRMFYLKNYLMENILSRFFLTIKLYKNANIYK